MQDLAPGRRLGDRFVLVRRLAEGGGGEAWLAEDSALQRRVALKVVPAGRIEGVAAERRLEMELERARSLPPGVAVEVLGFHRLGEHAVLAMQYLPGGDLGQFRGRPCAAFARPLEDVARALVAVHAAGLVHGDLKCGNVLLDAEGRARLADFGLSTLAGGAVSGGSPYNMSPQRLRGEPAAAADDLYAFGAMLYELLCGHPPWYPQVTRERVLHDPVPPLVSRHPAPEPLRQLALRLLAKSPAQRLPDAPALAEALAAALAAPAEPDPLALPVAATATVRPGRAWRLPAAAALLAAGAAVVFLWLPQQLRAPVAADAGEEAAARARAQVEELRRAQADAASAEQARAAAEALREPLAGLFASLEPRGAGRFAVEDWAEARRQQAEGERQYEARRYAAAAAAWQASAAALEAAAARAPAALAEALAEGAAALEAGRALAAADAFQRALAIEPGHAGAQRGIDRAASLDAVLARLDAAARDEAAGRLDAAEQGYRGALALDPEAPGAAAALERIAARRSGDAFAAAMARGLGAVTAGRAGEARTAFEQALALRPGSAEARDALAQLAGRERAATLAALERRALEAERAERWGEARDAWNEALALEPALAAGREGVARAEPRIQLDARLAALLAQPERVWTPAGRDEARAALAAAAAAAAPRQRLEREAAELAARVAAAEVPVRVALVSDGQTDVVINRVGRLGAFERHEVELLPGRYAVVGTRRGYRDVRREVLVGPDGLAAPLAIRCEEPL